MSNKFTTDYELDQWFGYHPPTSAEVATAHEIVRKSCRELAQVLSDLVPEGAEKTLALRKIREAMFYANAAIAVRQEVFLPADATFGDV